MNIIDGKLVAQSIKDNIKSKVEQLGEDTVKPKLVCIIVGNNPASESYVRSKIKSCEYCGIESEVIRFEETVAETKLLWEISRLNKDKYVHGIIVQLPLPKHIREEIIINAISPEKDVDGFHVINQGKLVIGDKTGFVPATPLGITKMLDYYNIDCTGKKCVIIGRSNIVGKPIAQLMLQRNASVTILHSKSKNMTTELSTADIIIAAVGKPEFVEEYMIKDNVIIIDVGINRVSADNNEKGYKIVGDVDFNTIQENNHFGFITPVPGGVGLTTVAALIGNTWKSYNQYIEKHGDYYE